MDPSGTSLRGRPVDDDRDRCQSEPAGASSLAALQDVYSMDEAGIRRMEGGRHVRTDESDESMK